MPRRVAVDDEPVERGLKFDLHFVAGRERDPVRTQSVAEGAGLAIEVADVGDHGEQQVEGDLLGVIWAMSRLGIGEPYGPGQPRASSEGAPT